MKGTILFSLFAAMQIVFGLYQKDKGLKDWHKQLIGEAKYVHFYYNGKNVLKGVFVATNQGSLAMLNPQNGNIIWRQRVLSEHSVGPVIFQKKYALIATGNEREVQLWNLEKGNLMKSFGLIQKETKDKFVDMSFIESHKSKFPSFVIMTNHWIEIYRNLEIFKKIEAEAVSTFCMVYSGKDPSKITFGVISNNSDELNIQEYSLNNNQTQKVQSIKNFKADSQAIKTSNNFVSYNLHTKRDMNIYNFQDKKIIGKKIEADLYSVFEPTNIFVAFDNDNYYLNSFNEHKLDFENKLSKSRGTYVFGVSPDEKTIVYSHTISDKTEIYESYDGKAFKLISIQALEKKIYGTPEAIYVSPYSSIILIKTKDKSLHLIEKSSKKWTRDEGLSGVISWKIGEAPLTQDSRNEFIAVNCIQRQISDFTKLLKNSFSNLKKFFTSFRKEASQVHSKEILYGVTKYGSLYALNPINGKILWQRTVSGNIIGFHPFSNTEENILVLVVQYETGTKIFELNQKTGKELVNKKINEKITQSQLLKLESKQKVLLLVNSDIQMYVYPDTEQTNKIVQTILPHITFFRAQKEENDGERFIEDLGEKVSGY